MPKDILGYESYSISDYLAMPNIPQPYLVEGMLYVHGKTVLVGKPKVGKSTLSIKTGYSVALGESLLGLRVIQAPVLFLEFDRRYLINTVHEICGSRETDMMDIVLASGVALNEWEGYRLLLASVHECYKNSDHQPLVIIDHKSACFAGKENEDQANRKWLETLDKVNRIFPVTYLVICQAPKGWKGDIVDLPFGSRLLTAWADTIISIEKPNRNTRRLDMASNYGGIEPITYTKNFEIVGSDITEDTKLEAARTIIEEQWDEFRYPHITEKVAEVAEKLECSYTTAWAAYSEVKQQKKTTGSVDDEPITESKVTEGESNHDNH